MVNHCGAGPFNAVAAEQAEVQKMPDTQLRLTAQLVEVEIDPYHNYKSAVYDPAIAASGAVVQVVRH
ncbi:MAG TPA: hypothetical protein VD735_02690 [Candidatus Saccharimonadales bacterium]|nr:hypothetical protein [Candidatus Saccharimonadales bacterium]